MKEIDIRSIENIRIGQTENAEAATGCTVFIRESGMAAGMDVRGGGPACRDSYLLDPLSSAEVIHALLLAGGSAFGLDAAGGVMKCLEERGIGYDTGAARVPLVCQSNLYDLAVGRSDARPDPQMGYDAAVAALNGGNYRDGNFGAGCGATVGKWHGIGSAMKSGIGSYAVQIGALKIGAVVAVNALGDIFDSKTGRKVAGLLAPDGKSFEDTFTAMSQKVNAEENKFTGNTTLAVIITNAAFDKRRLCKIAGMGQDGLARSVNPVHTSADGDTVYALSVGDVAADQDVVGTLAARVVSEAILRAALSAEDAYGFKASRSILA